MVKRGQAVLLSFLAVFLAMLAMSRLGPAHRVLVASLLGLGAGSFAAKRRSSVPVISAILATAGLALRGEAFEVARVALVAVFFVPIGQALGRTVEEPIALGAGGLAGLGVFAALFGPTSGPRAPVPAEVARIPYHLVAPKSVLVLGAGADEVAAALSAGAARVVAVDIDLREIDPRAEALACDPRVFLERTHERFDLAVMPVAVSGQELPGTGLAVESYRYTLEAFKAVRRALAPGGAFVLTLVKPRPWVVPRASLTVSQAFEQLPVLYGSTRAPGCVAIVVGGPEAPPDRGPKEDGVVRLIPPLFGPTLDATDDWPRLDLETRFPSSLLVLGALLAAAAIVLVLARPDVKALGLGCGSFLLAARSLASVALLAGSTWNTLAIMALLVLALGARALVARGHAPGLRASASLLAGTLLAAFLLPLDAELPVALRLGVAALPVFFAVLTVSLSAPKASLGSLLLGAVLGGLLLEPASAVLGARALLGVAFLAFALGVRTK